jgi:hypothetical protein
MPELPITLSTETAATHSYEEFLEDIKGRIRSAQARAINAELIGVYWQIGKEIERRQAEAGPERGRRGWCSGCRPICGRLSLELPGSRPRTSRVCGLSPWLGQTRRVSHTVCKTFRGGTSSSWCRSSTTVTPGTGTFSVPVPGLERSYRLTSPQVCMSARGRQSPISSGLWRRTTPRRSADHPRSGRP